MKFWHWLGNFLQLVIRLLMFSITIGWVLGSSICSIMLVFLFFLGFDISMYIALKIFLVDVLATGLFYLVYVFVKNTIDQYAKK